MPSVRADTPPGSGVTRTRLLVAVMLLAGALAYANGMTGAFVWDDRSVVVENTRAHGLSHLPELLGFGDARFGFRMMRDLSYALDYTVGGLNPLVYHLSNLLYHLLTVFLVWALARRLGFGGAAAFWAGLLFAVHPAHTDAVTYISGRRDVLSTAFYLGSVLAFARYRDGNRPGWLAGAAALGALGAMAKEMAATLPLAWVLYDAWRLAEGGRITAGARAALARHWRLYGLGALAAAAFLAYEIFGQGLTLHEGPIGDRWGVHAMTMTVILAHALKMLLFPVKLLIDYQHYFVPVAGPGEARFLVAAAVLAVAVAAAWRFLARRRAAAFAAHWVWITYLPVMQIIPHPERFAEHYLYLPSVGAALLAGAGIAGLAARPGAAGRAAVALGAAAMVVLGARTVERNRDFAGEIPVFEAEYKLNPRAARVWNNLALAYAEAGERERGIDLLQDVLPKSRDPMLVINLTALLGEEGRWREALPWLMDAYGRDPADPRVLEKLGEAFYRMGQMQDARRAWEELLAVRPGSVAAFMGLANVARSEGNPREAADYYRAVTVRTPDAVGAWNGLGVALQAQGDRAGARDAFRRVLELDPEDGDAWNNLGVLAMLDGDRHTAETHFERAAAVERPIPMAVLNLARLKLERGDCAGARRVLEDGARQGLALRPTALTQLDALARAACPAPGGP